MSICEDMPLPNKKSRPIYKFCFALIIRQNNTDTVVGVGRKFILFQLIQLIQLTFVLDIDRMTVEIFYVDIAH